MSGVYGGLLGQGHWAVYVLSSYRAGVHGFYGLCAPVLVRSYFLFEYISSLLCVIIFDV